MRFVVSAPYAGLPDCRFEYHYVYGGIWHSPKECKPLSIWWHLEQKKKYVSARVIIVDDHPLVRVGLANVLSAQSIETVAQLGHHDELLGSVETHEPHAVLLDVCLGRQDCFSTLDAVHQKYPQVPVIVVSAHDNPTYVARSCALGATDYLRKSSPVQQIVESVQRAVQGRGPADSSLLLQMRRLLQHRPDPAERINELTNREFQVLRHIALGLSNREIGNSLGISIETVKEHVQNILRKVKASDRTQAAVWAVRNKIV